MSDIVIYEDDALMRTLLTEWLSEEGYRVRAPAPREARREHFDLVIASVYMRERGGAETAREIRASHPLAPLIAISGQFRTGIPADGAAARVLGVERVTAKPLRRDDLLAAVLAMIGAPS